MDSNCARRIAERLDRLYGPRGSTAANSLLRRLDDFSAAHPTLASSQPAWDQRDVVLISYADQLRDDDVAPLLALRHFLLDYQLADVLNTVHLLPFYPSSSDDGFSVIDYRQVDPAVGNWHDVAALGQNFRLMFDLVLNHVSQQSAWFQAYLRGETPYDRFFIEVDPSADVSRVTRPRSLPLLTPFDTAGGRRYVWTTFSADQVDLNYAEPLVLQEIVDVLLHYLDHGARIIRLDAVAYLWKQLGTSCIHLSETHQVVKLFRDVLSAVAPQTLILTETNVPHVENISYFGDADEAQMVYQFSLPPLLLDATLNEDAGILRAWLEDFAEPPAGATYFNFTASHDGIGVRPLEGLVSPARLERLVQWVRQQGGRVSLRRQPDGSEAPYELNVTYLDALADPVRNRKLHVRRFLASQAMMLAVRGIPAVYFHSLVGTQNDLQGVAASGQARRINRRRFTRAELDDALAQ